MKELYFVALLVPEPHKKEIDIIRNDLETRFGCRHALKSPPHITVHMPFRLDQDKVSDLKLLLKELQKPKLFFIDFGKIDHFDERTIFIDVKNDEMLSSFRERLQGQLYNELLIPKDKRKSFHPHVTLATRDVKPDMFPEMWNYLKNCNLKREIDIHSVSLLKHNGRLWDINSSYPC